MRRLCVCLTVGCGIGASPVLAAVGDGAPAAPQDAAKSAAEQHFDIFEYVVDGNTVLSAPEIEEAVYPFLGEDRSAADVDKAREALERVYREHGFQTVQVSIPQQRVESKIIHFQVAQNPVGRLRVVDSKYHGLEEIKKNAPSLAEGTVPDLNQVQKDIVALNQQSDLKVTPRLKAGQTPGTVDVDLQVEDSLPVHANLELNNQHNQKTTELRTIATVSYDNLWQLGHSASFTYQTAPENKQDAEVFSGSYLMRVPRSDWMFLAYLVKSNSAVAALPTTDVIGKGTIFGARGILNLPGSDTFYQSLSIGFDRKKLTQNVVTAGTPSDTPVLYYPVSAAYSPTWRNGEGVTQGSVSLNFALPGLGSDSGEFDAQRFDALRQYFYVKAEASTTQPFIGNSIIFARIQGQVANGPLLSSEEMSAGGASTVRGYLEAERLGDNGYISTVEWRSPVLFPQTFPFLKEWRASVFADGGLLGLNQPLPGETDEFSLVDVGVGTKFSFLDTLNGSVDLAFPLISGTATRATNPHFHFRVWAGL
jgi:hemolysin activation/secretion protein